jgi:hypothetical protein
VRDGYFPYFVEADVYNGAAHQDGRTLLAMRSFLKSVSQHYPLSGSILIGSFPEAGLVRSVLTKRHVDEMTFESGRTAHDTDVLTFDAEYVTPRAEIVLADLDGNWEAVYKEAQFSLNGYDILPLATTTTFPLNGQTIHTPDYNRRDFTFEDVFLVADAQVTTTDAFGLAHMSITSIDEANFETTAADQQEPNRMARPEIIVSRIDARHVAIMPTTPPDIDGKTPLAADGKPQSLRFHESTVVHWTRRLRRLEAVELPRRPV